MPYKKELKSALQKDIQKCHRVHSTYESKSKNWNELNFFYWEKVFILGCSNIGPSNYTTLTKETCTKSRNCDFKVWRAQISINRKFVQI